MLGLQDPLVFSAYLLCILSTILCVAYGAIMWNRGGEDTVTEEDVEWAKEEDKIGEEL